MKIFTDILDETFTFELENNNGTSILKDGKKKLKHSLLPLGGNRFSFLLNDQSYLIQIVRENDIYHVHLEGEYFPIRVEDERTRILRELVQQASQASGEQTVVAPIPGLITHIKVRAGDQINIGDGLIVLEAMKMENEIKAEVDGTVKQILVEEGAAVEKDQKLMLISS